MSSQSAPVPAVGLAVYHFEGFTLDLAKGCLFKGSDQVKLRPKPFEALRYIVERTLRGV